MENNSLLRRLGTVICVLALLLLGSWWLLYDTQIVNGQAYLDSSDRSISDYVLVDAARGSITDRYGRVLVTNRSTYRVTLDTSVMGADWEETLLRLLEICEEEDVVWADKLPVTQSVPFLYTVDEPFASGETSTRLGKLIAKLEWGTELTASELVEKLREQYKIGDGHTPEEVRALVGICYELDLRNRELDYSTYAFAEDVDINFISRVKEEGLAGVTVETVLVREYETEYAAHLLGTVGAIRDVDWEDYQALGYAMDDIVGRDGVEAAFESYLRGVDGVKVVEYNKSGQVISETYLTEPEPGGNVALTIDIELQKAAEDALAAYVPGMNDGEGGGAAVVIDVRDGGVLACASYPTFDITTYSQEYNELISDPLNPALNRALKEIYSPGSTFKMVTATAGLQEGYITPKTQIRDLGVYHYYDAAPKCWIYNQSGGTHGLETVSDAIRDSCNYFFYDVGVNLGIETLDEYAAAYGLGQYTGVELPEEKGILAGPEYSASVGATWYGGNVLYAAIGQGDNTFTPIQVANYIATLANGGNHYSAHFLSSVKSYDYSQILYQYEPELLNTVELTEENLAAIKDGMYQVTQNSSAVKAAFANLDMKIGAKTGSAQITSTSLSDTNSVFVCFAPYDDPQIAVTVVVEKGGSGSGSAVIAADILEQYFGSASALEAAPGEYELLP